LSAVEPYAYRRNVTSQLRMTCVGTPPEHRRHIPRNLRNIKTLQRIVSAGTSHETLRRAECSVSLHIVRILTLYPSLAYCLLSTLGELMEEITRPSRYLHSRRRRFRPPLMRSTSIATTCPHSHIRSPHSPSSAWEKRITGPPSFYAYRGKLSLALARAGNLRAIFIEADATMMLTIDDYVMGEDVLVEKAVANLGFWITDVYDFIAVLKDIRTYNAAVPATDKIASTPTRLPSQAGHRGST